METLVDYHEVLEILVVLYLANVEEGAVAITVWGSLSRLCSQRASTAYKHSEDEFMGKNRKYFPTSSKLLMSLKCKL